MTEDGRTETTSGLLRRFACRVGEIVAAGLFALVFLISIYKIVLRYAAGDAVAWADEVSVVLFIWIIFWANAFLLRDRDQIVFDLLVRHLPESIRRAAVVLRLVLIGGIFLWALPGVIDYLLFLWRERTPVLGLRLDLVYSCFGLFVVAVVARCLANFVGLVHDGLRARR